MRTPLICENTRTTSKLRISLQFRKHDFVYFPPFPRYKISGVLFKVYTVSDAIKVVQRFPLPDVSKRKLLKSVGVFRFPRVSSAAHSADDAYIDLCICSKFSVV